MQVISGANVYVWISCESIKFSSFNLSPYDACFILPIIFVNFVNILQYCVTCSRILPVSVFCVLQGSGVTPLKCDEICDMDFVANFTENIYDSEKNWKSVNICQSYERMYIVAQFWLKHGVYYKIHVKWPQQQQLSHVSHRRAQTCALPSIIFSSQGSTRHGRHLCLRYMDLPSVTVFAAWRANTRACLVEILSKKISRSKVKFIYHQNLFTFRVHHTTYSYRSVVFSFCMDRQTHRHTKERMPVKSIGLPASHSITGAQKITSVINDATCLFAQ